MRAAIGAGLILGLALAGCREPGGGTPEDPRRLVIARVKGEKVQRGLFEAYLRDNINLLDDTRQGDGSKSNAEAASGALTDPVKSRLLDRFLEEQALLVEAKEAGIQPSEEALDRFSQAMSLGPLKTLHEGSPLTEREYLREYLEDCWMVKTYLDQMVLAKVQVSDEEARAYYDQHASQFSRPDRYRLRVIRVDSMPEAQEAQRQLAKDPGAFQRIAQSLSEGAESDQGKDLGLWRADELPAPIASAVAGLKKGEISGIVQDPDGNFNLFYLEDKEEGGTVEFEPARDRIRARVARERKAEVLADHLKQLGERVPIVVNRDKLGFQYTERTAEAAVQTPAPSPSATSGEMATPTGTPPASGG